MAKKSTNVWEKNFAEDAKVRALVEEQVLPVLAQRREARFELEEEWDKFYNMWNVKHDSHHTYNGRAKLYVPEVRKNVEAQARQLTEAAIPNEDFFDVSPGPGGSKKGALIRKSIARWQIEQAQLRVKLLPFLRQEVMLGTSPVYVPWSEKTNRVFRSARNPKTGKIEAKRVLVDAYRGPDFITRDLFRWYALNPLKNCHKEDGCFEDFFVSYFDLLAKKKKGLIPESVFDEIIEGNSDATNMDQLERFVRRMEDMGLQLRNEAYPEGVAEMDKQKALHFSTRRYMSTLVFLPLVLPQACEDGEDKDMPIPVQIEIFNNEFVGTVMRNQFWHQQDPYLVGKYIQGNADEFYGQGMPWATQYLQHELNSTAEQTMDSKTLALNPIAFIDPALAAQLNDFEVAPGARWFIHPNGVKLGSMPDLSGTGYNAMGYIKSQMQDYSDRTPAIAPQLQGKARSATQADIVNNAVQVDLKSFQVQNEILVLQPLMKMWESLTDQNIKEDQVIMILGRRATDWRRKLISKSSVLGSYEYFWKTVNQLQNKPVMARQLLDFLKITLSLPPEVQQKLGFNMSEAMKTLWTDLWMLPDADKLFGGQGEMETQDPEVEHKMLENGLEIEVLPGDADAAHLAAHDKFLGKLPKDSSDRKLLELHMLRHQKQAEAKKIILQRMQEAQQQMRIAAAQAAAQGNGQQPGAKPAGPGAGNRTQLSPNGSMGDMGSGVRA